MLFVDCYLTTYKVAQRMKTISGNNSYLQNANIDLDKFFIMHALTNANPFFYHVFIWVTSPLI